MKDQRRNLLEYVIPKDSNQNPWNRFSTRDIRFLEISTALSHPRNETREINTRKMSNLLFYNALNKR